MAHAMAMETNNIQADIIEADEFPNLARQFAVQAVPKTIINQTVEVLGSVTEQELLQRLLVAAGREDLIEKFSVPRGAGAIGGPTSMMHNRR
ncbi:hypothetical protein FIM02_03240 [SAR202 cluster bacterium AD-802-E10_MRT_200m]|nr:hypothetical protein [SAR202 cluster bacterium AD-802-E10_MRT_200m]